MIVYRPFTARLLKSVTAPSVFSFFIVPLQALEVRLIRMSYPFLSMYLNPFFCARRLVPLFCARRLVPFFAKSAPPLVFLTQGGI